MKVKVGDTVLIFNGFLRSMVHGKVVGEESNYFNVRLETGNHVFHFEKLKYRGLREGQHLQIAGVVTKN